MKKILVLGSSIAGVRAIEEIRRFAPDCETTILTDGEYPYDRGLFAPVLAKEVDYKKIFYKPNDYYEKNRVNVVTGKKIARINLKKCKVTTDDKQAFEGDVLIITDAPGYKLPEIKGVNKNGVYTLQQLTELDQILDFLPLIDAVVVQSDSPRGVSIASAFLKRDKEVIWVVTSDQIAQDLLNADTTGQLTGARQENKLRVVAANPIAEILGEGDVKAIRLKSGKVLAAQIIIFPDAPVDFRVLTDPAVTTDGKIRVNEQFQTGIEGVFALDAACVPRQEAGAAPGQENAGFLLVTVLEEQGATVAAALKTPKMADSNAS
ncbi:MAG TPA: hypothetical protein DE315_07605 [Candidatus Omnitrophica bacterium]|nr:MAG: hypothetical protein A2Y05_04060 [Omnitrophica WOR_2 bacterium GWA2_53_43]HBO97267.1 hypothetical protein [Candidatus Omnitrophota bacterium]HCI45375.1 hypothetical protein [Candidatus Omnitrophota bacterium]